MRRRVAYKIAPLTSGPGWTLIHALERFLHVCGGAKRQAGYNCPSGENFRIAGEHGGGHRPPRRKSGDENALPIDVLYLYNLFDHLPYRAGLSTIAADIFRIEPIETSIRIV